MLLDALLETAGRVPRKPAVADPFVRWEYRRFVLMAATVRDLIGASSGARNVGLLMPSTSLFAASYFGCLWANRTPVPLNFLLTQRELEAVIADAGLDLVLSLRPLKEQAETCSCKVIYLDEANLKTRAIWRSLRRLPPRPQLHDDDVAALIYTSGTSGEPKGVMLTHQNLYADSRACIEHVRIDPDRRFIGVLPLFHSFGLMSTCVLPLILGASVYYLPRFLPTQVVKSIVEEKIDIMMAIPSMYAALARMRDIKHTGALRSMYLAISGGEPLPANVTEAVRENLGLTIYEGYGMTETSPVVSINTPWKYRPGTVGAALPGVEIRVVSDGDTPQPPGATGNIQVRGPIVMKGYYKKLMQRAER